MNASPLLCILAGGFLGWYTTFITLNSHWSAYIRIPNSLMRALMWSPIVIILAAVLAVMHPAQHAMDGKATIILPDSTSSFSAIKEHQLQLFVCLPGSRTVTFHGSTNSTVGDVMDFITLNSSFSFYPGSLWRLSSGRGTALTDRASKLVDCGLADQNHVHILCRLLGGSGGNPRKRVKGAIARSNISDKWLTERNFERREGPMGIAYACKLCPYSGKTRRQLEGHLTRCKCLHLDGNTLPEDYETTGEMHYDDDLNASSDGRESEGTESVTEPQQTIAHTRKVMRNRGKILLKRSLLVQSWD
ncbi:hypothetical protein Vretimale_10250 [Volvox reticuliferus]|uniref:Ubiquitin-like domain-containing protein n=1 Tax=Volvox reticuliferus TaxID=1737510 RepID=A0A8J4BYD5_9CHLO|nr:hypothetical protein Vretifemale_543 [Volvox reticuliferus]GIM05883.1 hypothetical protein Vretimale_10250 [Volvox reticuliferus]